MYFEQTLCKAMKIIRVRIKCHRPMFLSNHQRKWCTKHDRKTRNHWCKAKLTTENQSKNFPRLSLYMLPIKKLSILLHDVLCNIWTSLCKNMHLFLLIKNANDYNVHVCPVIIWVWTKLVPRPNTKNIVELQTPDYIRSNNNEGVHWWSGIQWF